MIQQQPIPGIVTGREQKDEVTQRDERMMKISIFRVRIYFVFPSKTLLCLDPSRLTI